MLWVLAGIGAVALGAVGAVAASSSPQGRPPRGVYGRGLGEGDDFDLPRDWGWADIPEHERPDGWDRW